jgi:hypothetical protein
MGTPLLWRALVILKRTAALAAAAGALALAGCGDDDADEKRAAERVAREFALADGPEACDLMSENALEDVYGLDDSQHAYYNCIDRSDRFEGQEIDIEDTKRGEDDRITVTATTPDDRQFKVTLNETAGEWKVDRVIEE